jgi:hypothetical protein
MEADEMALTQGSRRDWDQFSSGDDFRFNMPPLPRITGHVVKLNPALWPPLPCGCAVDDCKCEESEANG